jgi:ethanolamine-phosphate cytidylyltransferase
MNAQCRLQDANESQVLLPELQRRVPVYEPVLHQQIVAVIGIALLMVQYLFRKKSKWEWNHKSVERGPLVGNKHEKTQVRIFMDGAFDLTHYGHMNAFRLGRSLGSYLVVGVNSDESIAACKGDPLLKDQERLTMVESCKFVDEVVSGCPYIMTESYLNYIVDKYSIDYVVHGDDPCIVDGKDVYEAAKRTGKYRSIPRTEGVSTTDIVGRMLLLANEHHNIPSKPVFAQEPAESLGQHSRFLTTARLLKSFSTGVKPPTDTERIVYMDGAWDLFHCGHAEILKKVKERGGYLIVGVHSDTLVSQRRGSNLPLMHLLERVLSVLGCRFVDDVLIDAPYEVSPEMISSLRINEVVHGTTSDATFDGNRDERYVERYKHPREAGIFTMIESPINFKQEDVMSRIREHQAAYEAKFARKLKAEIDFYEQKYNIVKVHSANEQRQELMCA